MVLEVLRFAINLIDTPVTVDFDGGVTASDTTSITANADQTVVTLAIGGAGAGGFSLGGSVAVTELGRQCRHQR